MLCGSNLVQPGQLALRECYVRVVRQADQSLRRCLPDSQITLPRFSCVPPYASQRMQRMAGADSNPGAAMLPVAIEGLRHQRDFAAQRTPEREPVIVRHIARDRERFEC